MPLLQRFLQSRFWALVLKEIQQILRNRQIIFLLLFPPTIQLLVFGLALNPDVTHLDLGLVDYSRSAASRALISTLVENDLFNVKTYVSNPQQLGQLVERGQITAGIVIPPNFRQALTAQEPVDLQVLVDGVDANTAGLAQGYISQLVNHHNQTLRPAGGSLPVETQVRFLYNPGLLSSWFFVPGMIGVVLTLTGSLVSSTTVIREKDVGTLEQLLMTPAAGWEILGAKIAPLFGLLLGDVFLASAIGRFGFGLPFRGNYALFVALSAIYVFVCIGLGILLATLAKNQQQVILTSFFFNVPLIQLSGAIAPIESMPPIFRMMAELNPLRHYVEIARSLILKGVGLAAIWPHALALVIFAIGLLAFSSQRFRQQLA